jgi:hypothetical protein
MYRKLPILEIALALSIPAFPLGALFFLSKNSPRLPEDETPAPAFIREYLNELPEKNAPGKNPSRPVLAFHPRITGGTIKETPHAKPEEPPAPPEPAPVFPGDTFKYLGLVKEADGREQLYLKNIKTGRVIAVNTDSYAVSMDGEKYIIRRN